MEKAIGILLSLPLVNFSSLFEVCLAELEQKKQKNISFKLFHLPREHWISAWNGNVLFALIKMQGGCKHSGVQNKATVITGRSLIFVAFKWPEAALGRLEKPGSY
jgi:hypothetical protein